MKLRYSAISATMLFVLSLCFVAPKGADAKRDEQREMLETAFWSGEWNNQIASLIRSNKLDMARGMLNARVALEVADLWRGRSQFEGHRKEMLWELFTNAVPTVLDYRQSPKFHSQLPKAKSAIDDYLRAFKAELPTDNKKAAP